MIKNQVNCQAWFVVTLDCDV